MLLEHYVTKWLETNRLKVQHQRCIRTRNRFATCQKCEEVCPVSAITLEDGLSIQADLCTECMRCTSNCPSEALFDEKYTEFFKEMSNRDLIAFSCENDKREEPLIKLGCLFQLDKALLIHAIANSKRVSIQFDRERCIKCNKYHSELKSSIEKTVSELNFMLIEPVKIHYNDYDYLKMERNYTRRELIAFFSKKMTRNVISPLISDEEEIKNLRESIKSGVQRKTYQQLLKKYQSLFKPEQESRNLNTLRLRFLDYCDGCKVCERVCPTGALMFSDGDEESTAMFDWQRCNGCQSCIDICRKDALDIDDTTLINLQDYLRNNTSVVTYGKKDTVSC